MKDIDLPLDNDTLSLDMLTEKANNIIESLEKEKDLQNSIYIYQELLKLNKLIEKKFNRSSMNINEETKKKINSIANRKNAK